MITVKTATELLLVLTLTTCVPDDGRDGETGDTDIAATGEDPSALDSTGTTVDPCTDDYDGNHDLASAHPLLLDTTENALVVLGDGILSGASVEQGQDLLVVCGGRPDFFSFDAACPGYLIVDSHGAGGGDIDLVVHADGGAIVEAIGTWRSFFLKAIVLPIDAGAHVLEIRDSGNGARSYAMSVRVLPIAPCP